MNDAKDWKREHGGFHYPSFYNFIVDHFEDVEPGDKDVAESLDELLHWWNRYDSFYSYKYYCPEIT